MSTIPSSKEEARSQVERLVERFRENIESYKSSSYNETQTRREFIDPLFKALGWDVDNESGYAEAYKDVVHEDAVKVGGMTKAPDYSFRIGGQRKFFVEAKKPAVDMKKDPEPYYQLRRYAFSAKLPLSILTDFEELAIVDCRNKPSPADKASKGRIRYWRYEEYLDNFDEIYDTFSKEAVLKGSFDRYITSVRKKRGTGEVDKEFLKEIEDWRSLLARNIALRNPALTQRELNAAVQLTIDRIIFLRICEDRGIEEYGVLHGIFNGSNVYGRLMELFRRADERYNSGLFHFQKEKGRPESYDDLTPGLTIDDKVLKDILKRLYYPDCPYEFSVLPVDILGQVYEQFLGKVIRLTAGHRAVVEDKPEVKKAGGVYYTPTYIVEYIVKNTVGKLLEKSTPTKAAKLRILDPACGSGSFLIGAFQYLMDWHRDWYQDNDPDKWARRKEPRLFMGKDGWQLTTAEKKRILLNNIYGVDIDPAAAEVTKLSLLLKVLEGESAETIGKNLSLFHERALPDLRNNIKCGNSLIGSDFYEGQQMGLLDEDERLRINAFDWDVEFPEIFCGKNPGFDAVIGNPPYVRIQALKEWAPVEVEFYKKRYRSAGKGNYDIYVVFVERGLELLNQRGRLGYILPHKFFNAKYGEPLRDLIEKGRYLSHVVHFGDQQVFERATTYTCLLFLKKGGSEQFEFKKIESIHDWQIKGVASTGTINATRVSRKEWNFVVGKGSELFIRLSESPYKLGAISKIFVGLQTSADTVFLFKDCVIEKSSLTKVRSKALEQNVEIESLLLRSVIRSGSIGRYWSFPNAVVLFPYNIINGKAKLISESALKSTFPKTWSYFLANKELLAGREHGKFRNTSWYQLYPKNLDVWEQRKIMVPYMITRLAAYYDNDENYFVNVTTGGFGIVVDEKNGKMEYITGLLNSCLLDWYLKQVSTNFHGGYFAANKQYLTQLPIRLINFSDPTDKARHDHMVEMVEQMLELNKQLQAVKTSHEKNVIQRQIEATDRRIDQLVYKLYDLTDKEIEIVESSGSQR